MITLLPILLFIIIINININSIIMAENDWFISIEKYKKRLNDDKQTKFATDEELNAMVQLGNYYEDQSGAQRNDYENMLNYYSMAAENGSTYAMFCLGIYYQKNENEENMLKYYNMAIESGCGEAMYNLGVHYNKKNNLCTSSSNQKDRASEENMLKYYLMAAETGIVRAMYNLGNYYQKNNEY